MDQLAPQNHNATKEDIQYDELLARKDELKNAANIFLADNQEISDDGVSSKVTDFVGQLRACEKQIEDARKAFKKPHADAGNAVHARFNGLKPELTKCLDVFKRLQGVWLQKKEQERLAEVNRLEEEALEAERLAVEAAAVAEKQSGDIIGNQVRAEEAVTAADEALETACKTSQTSTVARGNFASKGMSLRTTWHAEITNLDMAVNYYRDHPKMTDLIKDLANQTARSSKGKDAVPGVRFFDRKSAA